ncbi:MAG: ABC transporter permease [Gemmatimonadaceae bacterium]|jgi:hypothetical protein|nr:ABC transporter permease [Gemmatimonadaceae bacterium]
MTVPLHRTFASEWFKGRRTVVGPLVVAGGLLVPAGLLLTRLRVPGTLPELHANDVFWEVTWNQAWESIAVLLLPLGAIVLTALVTHHEHRWQGWKQLHATPQHPLALYAAKFAVVMVRLLQSLVVLLVGIWAVGVLPALLLPTVAMPTAPFPVWPFLVRGLELLRDVLPLVAIQFALGILVRNVVVVIGVGLAAWVAATVAIATRVAWAIPYAYAAMDHLDETGARTGPTPASLPVLAISITVGAFGLGAALYASRRDRG